jgi:hypothetical protein
MHLVKADGHGFRFQLSTIEKRALFAVIRQYPLVPAAHHRLTLGPDRIDDQALLEESLQEHRRAQRKQVETMLRAKSKFRETEDGWLFSLKPGQMEWLLQVLNDVRVGSWLALGSPDGPQEVVAAVNENNVRQFRIMELAGRFQMVLLMALGHSGQAPAA